MPVECAPTLLRLSDGADVDAAVMMTRPTIDVSCFIFASHDLFSAADLKSINH